MYFIPFLHSSFFTCMLADCPQPAGETDIDGTATIPSQRMPGESAMYVVTYVWNVNMDVYAQEHNRL